MGRKAQHGQKIMYEKYNCRCDDCTKGAEERQQKKVRGRGRPKESKQLVSKKTGRPKKKKLLRCHCCHRRAVYYSFTLDSGICSPYHNGCGKNFAVEVVAKQNNLTMQDFWQVIKKCKVSWIIDEEEVAHKRLVDVDD